METHIQTRRERKMRRRNEEIITFLMGAVVSVLVVSIAILFIAANKNQHNAQINREAPAAPVCTSMAVSNSIPDMPLKPIVYEETFLYQEELEEMKYQEEIKKQEELKRQEELKKQEELRKQEEELLYLQKITFAEAQGESFEGKLLVAASVVNRKNHPTKFPDTIKDVVEEVVDGVPQYTDISYICDEYINQFDWRKKAWDECREAAERALAGEDPAAEFFGGATLYFYNPEKCDYEQLENREGILMYVEGNHNFHHEVPEE